MLDSGLFVSSNGFACSFEKTINEVLALFLHGGKVKIMRFSVFFLRRIWFMRCQTCQFKDNDVDVAPHAKESEGKRNCCRR